MKKQTAKMVGACITGAVLTLIGIVLLMGILPSKKGSFNDDYYFQFVSRDIWFHQEYGKKLGYLSNHDGKTLKNVSWIAKPLGDDSLACYSDGKKRGYFNIFTGKAVIKPKYAHAWIFSDGLAAVEEDGWIKFIDQTGRVVIDNRIPYLPGKDGHVFHNGHCVVQDRLGERVGLIDKQGNWVLQPEYLRIETRDSLWFVNNGKQNAVLSPDFKTILPFSNARFQIVNGMIEAKMPDHTVRTYNKSGELTEDFYISDVSVLMYDTGEVYYSSRKDYNYTEEDYSEDRIVSETETLESHMKQAVAHCRCYEAEYGWFGLMTPHGKIITPPSYSMIKAIGPDLYFCKIDGEKGLILDGKGQRVK